MPDLVYYKGKVLNKSKSVEEVYADYVAAVRRIPALEIKQDLELARRCRDHNDEKARNRLVGSHLRLVLIAARRASKKYEFRWDYEKLLSLVGAGNDGLFHAAFLFDPNLGHRFATHALPWINKEIWRQARFDRSVVDRPDNIKFHRDVQLDHVRHKKEEREIEIAVGRVAKRRLCLEPSQDGNTAQGSNFVDLLCGGYATVRYPSEATVESAHAAIEENEILSGKLDDLHSMLEAKANQILEPRDREIYRARYLFPARKIKLKELARRYGVADARISQIATEANKKVIAAINPLADCYRGEVRFPTWRTIGDWCDHPKEQRNKSIADWCGDGDYHIDRVRAALDAGISAEEIGQRLDIPTSTAEDPNYNPAAHFATLAEYRRIAEEQDRES